MNAINISMTMKLLEDDFSLYARKPRYFILCARVVIGVEVSLRNTL